LNWTGFNKGDSVNGFKILRRLRKQERGIHRQFAGATPSERDGLSRQLISTDKWIAAFTKLTMVK
jgi:hypothetical protein